MRKRTLILSILDSTNFKSGTSISALKAATPLIDCSMKESQKESLICNHTNLDLTLLKDLNNNQQSFPKRNLNKVSLKTKSETVLTTIWVRTLSLFKLFRKKIIT